MFLCIFQLSFCSFLNFLLKFTCKTWDLCFGVTSRMRFCFITFLLFLPRLQKPCIPSNVHLSTDSNSCLFPLCSAFPRLHRSFSHLLFHCVCFYRFYLLGASMTDLQGPAAHTCGARCFRDLDRQGSDPHQHEAAGDAERFLQVSTAEHQTACRLRAAPLVRLLALLQFDFMWSLKM